jgi:hypothetical protein
VPPPTPVTPTQPPSPVPSPTQTVVVNLPPDVVNKLSPHESGLPQSWATIIAATIAVLAALIALAGVSWQVRSAAAEARKDRESDARLARQQHVVERMAEAIASYRSLQDLLASNTRRPLSGWPEAAKNAFNEQTQRMRALHSMLWLLGARRSSQAVERVVYQMNVIAKDRERGVKLGRKTPAPRVYGKSTLELVSEMYTAFEDDLAGRIDPAETPTIEPQF